MTLSEIVEKLIKVDDISWGVYAFSRDPLNNKISYSEKKNLIKKAIKCGKMKAKEIYEQYETNNIKDIAKYLGLKVEYMDTEIMNDRILFALFTPPQNISIMKEPIKKALLSKEVMDILTEIDIENLILGHEIFHFIEEEDNEIFTRKQKITLWKLFNYKHTSTIRALSEIAAMYFAKEFNTIAYSPFLLDVILYYGYNKQSSEQLYLEIVEIWQQETINGEYK